MSLAFFARNTNFSFFFLIIHRSYALCTIIKQLISRNSVQRIDYLFKLIIDRQSVETVHICLLKCRTSLELHGAQFFYSF